MLKLKHLKENFDLASQCLELYPHDEDSIDYMKDHYHISSNAVYSFKKDGQICYLRLIPVEEKKASDVISIVEAIMWLRGEGYHAMKPVITLNGKRVDVIETEWGNYVVTAFYTVRGKAIKNSTYSDELIEGYGEALGRYHKLISSYPHDDGRLDLFEKIENIRRTFVRFHVPSYMMEELNSVEEGLKKLTPTNENYGLIHYCFSVANVFYDEREERYNVIDFDDMFYSFYAMDIERSLISLSKIVDKKHQREAREAFLYGYQKERHLYDKEEATLSLMKRFIILDKYSNMKYVLSENAPNATNKMIYQRDELIRRSTKIENDISSNV